MNFVAQKIGKRYFANSVKSYEPIDPYREVIGNQSVKRAIPKGLSKKDAAVLLSVRRRAHHLDKGEYSTRAKFQVFRNFIF